MIKLFPSFENISDEAAYSDLEFPHGRPDRPYTVINMVTTVDGKASVAGRAGSIGSKIDHALMRKIRAAVDAVMVGAATLRAETVNPLVPEALAARRQSLGMPSQPLPIVVTESCDLPLDHMYFRLPDVRPVVVTCKGAPASRVAEASTRARVLQVGDDTVDLARMMGVLAADLGVRRLVVEGGPSLNGELVSRGLVDELFWTLAPKVQAGVASKTMVEGPALPPGAPARLELVTIYSHESELYFRYRFV